MTNKQENCKYCHKPFEEIVVLEYDLASVGIGQNNELYGGGTGDDEYGYHEVHAKINFCPMCGRELNDE